MCAFEENLGDLNKSGNPFEMLDPTSFEIREEDLELFEKKIASFLPDEIFDSHAHWYDIAHLQTNSGKEDSYVGTEVGYNRMKSSLDLWMGLRDHNGLYFPFPVKHLDCGMANSFLHEEIRKRHQSRALMMIRPNDEPNESKQKSGKKDSQGSKFIMYLLTEKKRFLRNKGSSFLTGLGK